MIDPARRGLYENKLWLPVIGSVEPNLVAKIPTEEASYFFRTKVFAVEETSRGEVVGISADNELLVWSQVLFRVVLYVPKTAENAFGDVILLQG